MKWRDIFRRRQLDQDLDEEVSAHLEIEIKRRIAEGEMPEAARTAAMRDMRSVDYVKETTRDAWSWSWLDDGLRDLRYAFRALRQSPGFFLGASLILSLGIGVNLAAFQLLDKVFWMPSQIRDPDSLVRLPWSKGLSYPAIDFIRSSNNVLSSALIRHVSDVTWGDDSATGSVTSFVSANWFDELGYRPLQGRVFQEGIDDAADATPVVVISESFWKWRLNRDPGIVGKSVLINNRPAVVLGIVPPDIMPQQDTKIWLPLTQIDYFIPGTTFKSSWDGSNTRAELYGRLRQGVSSAAATIALREVMAELANRQPGEESLREGSWAGFSGSSGFVSPRRRQEFLLITGIAGGLTLVILIIACANLSSLILSRGLGRVRELSIRIALGASRWKIMRHLLSESVLLAAFSAVGGLISVYAASKIFFAVTDFLPEFTLNWRTVFVALLTAGVAMAAVGLIPAWKISRRDLTGVMKDGGPQASARLSRTRLRHILLSAQLVGSCFLLVLTGLILHSFQRAMTERGFEFENVAVLTAPLARYGIEDAEAKSYWRSLRGVVAAHPETEAVALLARPPLENAPSVSVSGLEITFYEVESSFFSVMGVPLLAGRSFDASDEFRKSVVVSRRLALEIYGTLDVLGQRFPKDTQEGTIVGVVADARLTKNERPNGADLYTPINPQSSRRALIARAKSDARSLIPMMKAASNAYDGRVVPNAQLLSEDFSRRMGESRAMSRVMSVLASMALAITCIGVFGIVSYAATLRRKEIGIRLALGATRRSIILLFIKHLTWPLVGGIACGLTGAVLLGSTAIFAERPLYVKAFDVPVLITVTLFLVTTAGVAAVLPAWRALRSDVLQALRSE